jgi:hypothetical protein
VHREAATASGTLGALKTLENFIPRGEFFNNRSRFPVLVHEMRQSRGGPGGVSINVERRL